MAAGPIPSSFTAMVGGMETLRRSVINVAGAATPMGLAFRATTQVIGIFSQSLTSASDIVARFAQYSMAGLHAQVAIQIADIQRNIEISRKSGTEMELFAASSIKARDAWKDIDVEMNKITLKIGMEWNKMLVKIAPSVELFVKGFGKAIDNVMPYIDVLVNAFMSAVKFLQPVIDQIVDIGAAIADQLGQIIPPVISFAKTIVAAVGEFKPVWDVAVEIVKALIASIEPLVTIISGLTDALYVVLLPAFIAASSVVSFLGEMALAAAEGLKWLLKKINEWTGWAIGKGSDDRKNEIEELKKLVESARAARVQEQKKAIDPVITQAVIEARKLLVEGKLPPERMHEAALNPMEFFMGKAMHDFVRQNQIAAKALGGNVMAGREEIKKQEEERQKRIREQAIPGLESAIGAKQKQALNVKPGDVAGLNKILDEIKALMQKLEKIAPERAELQRKQLEKNLQVAPGRVGFEPNHDQIRVAMNDRMLIMSEFDGPAGSRPWMS